MISRHDRGSSCALRRRRVRLPDRDGGHRLRDHGGSGANRGHRFEDGANVGVWPDERERGARTHDLVHAQEQAPSDHAARVKLREVFLLKSARFEQDHGQRVA